MQDTEGKAKVRAIFAPFYTKNASFYQDRLGTNIGKTHTQSGVFLRSATSKTVRDLISDRLDPC
eukprot:COSAG06_NODE_3164_length_5749_cov_16.498407_6_plen_64_part_00